MKDYYSILGIPQDADEELIRKAYRKLSSFSHPDTQPENLKKWAEQRQKELNEAYSILINSDTRKSYNKQYQNYKNTVKEEYSPNNQSESDNKTHGEYNPQHAKKKYNSEPQSNFDQHDRESGKRKLYKEIIFILGLLLCVLAFVATSNNKEPPFNEKQTAISTGSGNDLQVSRSQPTKSPSIEPQHNEQSNNNEQNTVKESEKKLAISHSLGTPKQLIEAVKAGNYNEVDKLLESGINVEVIDDEGRTPLIHAVANVRTDIVKLLLTLNANPNSKDIYGWTSLHFAARYGYYEVAELLLSAGAHPDVQENQYCNSPLSYASYWGFADIVKLLVNHRADLALTDKRGNTALMSASFAGQKHIVDLLLKAGANPNATDNDGYTALMKACLASHNEKQYIDIVNILLEVGANPNIRSNQGYTALYWGRYPEVIELLKQYGAKE